MSHRLPAPRLGLRRGLACLALLALCVLGSSCYSGIDKRLIQNLPVDGFGSRYSGDSQQENWVDIDDTVNYVDAYNPEVVGQGRVDIDGTIIIDEVGAVHVAGLTRTEIEALLTQKLAPYYTQTDIRVSIQTAKKSYFIFGELLGPQGRKPHPGDLTIFEAVMGARPNPQKANLGRVRLMRADPRDPIVFTVNVGEILRTGDSTFNVQVKEGDIVIVPPTMLAQLGYFIVDLLTPFTEVLNSVFSSIFTWSRSYGNLTRLGATYGSGGFNLF
jgi:protein involved in polysaccharide export with SLBB domain